MSIKTKGMICLMIGITSVLTIIGTISYAYFTALGETRKQEATISTGTARATFSDNDTGITGELSFGESITKKFTIENTGTVEANVKMYFKDLINTYGIGSLTYTLSQSDTEDGTYTEVVSKTDMPRSNRPSKKRLVDQLTIPVGKTYYYELVITLNYLPDVNQDADINAKFSSSFELEDINEPEAPLPELMAITDTYSGKLWAHRDTIKRIVFEKTEIPRENATYTYDLSSAQDGSIMSYLYPDTEDSTKYIAYIQSEEGIKANSNSAYLFYKFTILKQIDNLYYLDTSNVTLMRNMFYGCSSLTSLDLSNFDTSNVINMNGMFYSCRALTSLDVNSFNTSDVTDMANMFYFCSNLTSLDLNNFNTESVTSMSNMFVYCYNLISLNVSSFTTDKVYDMRDMFNGCSSLASLDVSNFNTSRVTSMGGMFYNCSNLTSLDLSNFNTESVTDMSRMFEGCRNITTLDLNNFNTSKVTNMSYMFGACSSLISLDLSNFDTNNVIYMLHMFSSCSNLTGLNLKNWDVSKASNTYRIFNSIPSTIKINVSNSTMRQWVIDASDNPKLTASNVII